ncbi:MAG: aspartate aminotransferase family protein [Thermoleophilia bacterium]|jgi:glutamate-1-semialdehyde 2,1-aminomutase|nr:aspartate aminotransferase family protein [Thermoleophilia bacterium]
MSDHLIDDAHLTKTQEWFAKCQEVIAGGESSYARLIGTRPIVMEKGEGAHFWDVDGNRYTDWCIGYGPMIFGHRPKFIVDAIVEQITERGMLYTFPHELDYEVGRKIVQAVPGIDQIRFANSGSEATQAAIRLARGYTGKDKILKWEGSYNGFLDCHAFSHVPALEAAGSEKYPRTLPSLAGIPKAVEETVIVGCFNDLDSVATLIERHAHELAAVLAEPILADAGIIPPEPGFLEGVRKLCDEHGVLLIFDEVITGFRVALGGAQERYGVIPDITCVAKAVGGGTPGAAAFGARKEIMDVETCNLVLHGGTYSANPMTLAGMNAALDRLLDETEAVYGHLNAIADAMVGGMRAIFAEQGVPAYISQVGPMWQVFFGQEEPVTRFRQARASDVRFFEHLQRECQARGVYYHNWPFERFFASTAHTQADVDESLEVIETSTRIVKDRLGSLPEGV